MADALILTGGVAKGAFGAGALSVLSNEGGMDIRRVVATSSGAVNGAHFAAALRRGDERSSARDLAELWIERCTFGNVFDVDLRGLASLEGLSTNAKLLALLRRTVRPGAGTRDIELRIVVTGMAGVMGQRDPEATTFERVLAFDGSAFDGGPRFEFMLEAVTASAAFPFAFLPVHLGIRGETVACYDGGLADNAPVRHALDDPAITRVFVIVPFPSVLESSPGDAHGVGLLAHLGDVLISERLYRDLRRARGVNDALARLETMLTPEARKKALEALGWRDRRRIEIVEIRPTVSLEGNAFDGFFSRRLREDYVRAGEESARGWVRDRLGAHGPTRATNGTACSFAESGDIRQYEFE